MSPDPAPATGPAVACQDAEDFLRERAGCAARAIITDVPYCSGAATRGDRTAPPLHKYGLDESWSLTFEGDSRDERSFTWWCYSWMRAALRCVAPGGVLCTFIDWRQYTSVCLAMHAAGWVLRGMLGWDKGRGARPQPGRPRQQLELVPWATRGPYASCGLPPFDGCLPYGLRPGDKVHPVGKPVPVMAWIVRGFVPPGGLVLDPFAGSGSTGVDCAQLGRRFAGADICPKWATRAAARIAEARPEPAQLVLG